MANRIGEIIKEKGLSPKWVLEQLNEVHIEMDYHKFYRIRTNIQDPNMDEAIALMEILQVNLKDIGHG